jgi:hypothetical protein
MATATKKPTRADRDDDYAGAILDLLSGDADAEAVRLLAAHGFLAEGSPHEIADAAQRLRSDRRESERAGRDLLKRYERIEWTEAQRAWIADQERFEGREQAELIDAAYFLGIAVGRRIGWASLVAAGKAVR